MNSHHGQDMGPVNKNIGRHLLLGMIDQSIAKPSQIVGFTSNNRPVLYRNCDRAGRNLFAFFGPHNSGTRFFIYKNFYKKIENQNR